MKVIFIALLWFSGAAIASGGGGGGGGGAPADLLKLDPLVVNLSEGHFIQFTPQLKLHDAKDVDAVKANMPVLRFQLIKSLIGKQASEVQTAKFMAAFSEEAAVLINKALKEDLVTMVLFDGWLIQ
jgi:flagellar basal body-associated protein FliL